MKIVCVYVYVRAHVNAGYLRTFYEVLNLIFFLLSHRSLLFSPIHIYTQARENNRTIVHKIEEILISISQK